jgi:diguanylate cyclase (GGDEF)-like protein
MRDSDMVFRMGGEEFVCLLPNTTREEAVQVAERLRRSFQMAAQSIGDRPVNATLSVGISISSLSTVLPDGLLRRADEALYQAKNNGRNRIVLAEA